MTFKSDSRNLSALDAASNRVAHSESNMQLMVNAIAICAARKAMTAGGLGRPSSQGCAAALQSKAASTGRAGA